MTLTIPILRLRHIIKTNEKRMQTSPASLRNSRTLNERSAS